jgi:hypothetical protein
VGIVDDAVGDGVGDGRLADDVVPATDGDLADDEGGATAGRREDVRVAFVQPLDRDPWQRREDGTHVIRERDGEAADDIGGNGLAVVTCKVSHPHLRGGTTQLSDYEARGHAPARATQGLRRLPRS